MCILGLKLFSSTKLFGKYIPVWLRIRKGSSGEYCNSRIRSTLRRTIVLVFIPFLCRKKHGKLDKNYTPTQPNI